MSQPGFAPYGSKKGMRTLAAVMFGCVLALAILGAVEAGRHGSHAATVLFVIAGVGAVGSTLMIAVAVKQHKV